MIRPSERTTIDTISKHAVICLPGKIDCWFCGMQVPLDGGLCPTCGRCPQCCRAQPHTNDTRKESTVKQWISPYYFGIQIIDGVQRLVRRITKAARLEVVPDEDIAALHREGEERASIRAAQGIGGLAYDADGVHAVVVAADGSHSLLMANGGMPAEPADVVATESETEALPMTMRQQEFAIYAARVADQGALSPLPPGNQLRAPVAKRCVGCGRVTMAWTDDPAPECGCDAAAVRAAADTTPPEGISADPAARRYGDTFTTVQCRECGTPFETVTRLPIRTMCNEHAHLMPKFR